MVTRRKFLYSAGIGLSSLVFSKDLFSMDRSDFKAIAFDAFPIFDPRPVFKRVMDRFPEKDKQLVEVRRSKQFGYQWLRATGGQYKNFWEVTQDALVYAAAECKLELSAGDVSRLMESYRNIDVWPDVVPALQQLKERKLKLCFCSNMREGMLRQGVKNAGIDSYFDHIISTDTIKTYKPDPRAYQLCIDTLKLRKEEILFVAFAGWDVAGAKWFGYPTYWVDRLGSTAEELGVRADGVGIGLGDLVEFVKV